MLGQLNLSPEVHLSFSDEKGDIEKAKRPWDLLPSGHKIGKPEPLFKELVCVLTSSNFSRLILVYVFVAARKIIKYLC